ncbi:hypothetical protein GGD41_002125 [Paraburkholderia bryophila]|uniref:Uncharacterized protein n=1 Tax=Paraburkholderia bryophila TaxID=420952 RepID=A0A7Y9W6K0_9BURK|nr:hypothetical protein [Paraburkholderia bryophila]
MKLIGAGAGVERLEQRGQHRRLRHADLETLQIGRRAQCTRGGTDLPEAVVPHLADRHDAGFGDLRADVIAEVAIHRFPDRVVILERETGIDDAGGRRERRQNRRGLVEELHAAVAHLREQIGVGAELILRKQLDVEAAVGRVANVIDCFLRADVDRMGRVLAGGELVRKLGRGQRAARHAP